VIVILAALPGMMSALVSGNLAKPGNFSVRVNFLGSQLRIVGLVLSVNKMGRIGIYQKLSGPGNDISEATRSGDALEATMFLGLWI